MHSLYQEMTVQLKQDASQCRLPGKSNGIANVVPIELGLCSRVLSRCALNHNCHNQKGAEQQGEEVRHCALQQYQVDSLRGQTVDKEMRNEEKGVCYGTTYSSTIFSFCRATL